MSKALEPWKEELDRENKLHWFEFCRHIESGMSFGKSLEAVKKDKWWFGKMFKIPHMRKQYEDAKQVREEMRNEMMEDSMFSRAVEGVDKTIASGGQLIAVDKVYSDKLLEILYMKNHPELVQDKSGGVANVDILLQQIENHTPIGKLAKAEVVREALASGTAVAALPSGEQVPVPAEEPVRQEQ